MSVNVFIRATGERITGKFAVLDESDVILYSGIMPDGEGGFRGCGKKTTFRAPEVEVFAHRPDDEISGN